MPSPLKASIVKRIQDLLRQKLDPREIAKEVGCSPAIVYRFRQNLRYFEEPRAPLARQGRPLKLTRAILAGLTDFYAEYPTAYLDEAVEFVKEEFGIFVARSTLSEGLKRLRLSRKKVGNSI